MGNAVVVQTAAKEGDVASFHKMLAQWDGTKDDLVAELNSEDDNGYNALHYAIRYQRRAAVDLLLNMSADPNKKDKFGEPPIGTAVTYGDMPLCEKLISKDADIHVSSGFDGGTPIHRAAKYGHIEILRMLISRGASVNATDHNGRTALWAGILGNHVEVIEELLEGGSSPWQKDHQGKTAAAFAKERASMSNGKNPKSIRVYEVFGKQARCLRVKTALQRMRNNACQAKLDLSNSQLTDEAQLAMLAAALVSNTSLLELTLDGNQFGDLGALHIAAGLRENKCLRRISLRSTGIGAIGLSALNDALSSNFSLTEIVLNCKGMEQLAFNVSLNGAIVAFYDNQRRKDTMDSRSIAKLIVNCSRAGKTKPIPDLCEHLVSISDFSDNPYLPHAILLHRKAPDIDALSAVYRFHCGFDIPTCNLVERDHKRRSILKGILEQLAFDGWTSTVSKQSVLHRIVIACVENVLSGSVAAEFADAVVSRNPSILGSRDADGCDPAAYLSVESSGNSLPLVIKLSDLASSQFFNRFAIQDNGHPIKRTQEGVHILAHDTINSNEEVIFNFESRRQTWENEIYFRSVLKRDALDKVVIPAVASAIFPAAIKESKSQDILPEATTSKDVMTLFIREMEAAENLESIHSIGRLIAAAGDDGRLVDADLNALRAKYRIVARQLYSDSEEPDRNMSLSSYFGSLAPSNGHDDQPNSDEATSVSNTKAPWSNELWFVADMDKACCVSQVENGETGEFLIRQQAADHFILCYNDGGVVKEVDVVGTGLVPLHQKPTEWKELSDADVGARVSVQGYPCGGILRFFGKHAVKSALRCGVELDNPVGLNNGTVGGHTYFSCDENKGVLVAVEKVSRVAVAGTPLMMLGKQYPTLIDIVLEAKSNKNVLGSILNQAALCVVVLDKDTSSETLVDIPQLPTSIPGGSSFRPNIVKDNVPEFISDTIEKYPFLLVFKKESKALQDIIRDEALHSNSAACRSVVLDVCNCLRSLHAQSVVYGLLTPNSIMRTVRRGRASYRLYGLRNVADIGPPCRLPIAGFLSSLKYVPPEIAKMIDAETTSPLLIEEDSTDLVSAVQVDLWSLACIIFECYIGVQMISPDSSPTNWEGFSSTQRHQLLKSSGGYPLLDLMEWMTDPDCDSRPETIEDIFTHKYLASDGTLRRDRFLSAINALLPSSIDIEDNNTTETVESEISHAQTTISDHIPPKAAFFASPGDEAVVLPIALDLAPFMSKVWLGLRDASNPTTALVSDDIIEACDVIIVFISLSFCNTTTNWKIMDQISKCNTRVVAVNIDVPAHEWPPQTFRSCVNLETMSARDLIKTFGPVGQQEDAAPSKGLRFATPLEGSHVDEFWINKLAVLRGAFASKENALKQEAEDALRKAGEAQNELVPLKLENEELNATVQKLTSQIKALQISLTGAKDMAMAADSRAQELARSQQEAKVEIEDLSQIQIGLEHKVSELQTALKLSQKEATECSDFHENASASWTADRNQYRTDIALRDKRIRQLEDMQNSSLPGHDGYESELRVALAKSEALVQEKQSELTHTQTQLERMRAKAKSYQKKLKAIRSSSPEVNENAPDTVDERPHKMKEKPDTEETLMGNVEESSINSNEHSDRMAAVEQDVEVKKMQNQIEHLRAELETEKIKYNAEITKLKFDLSQRTEEAVCQRAELESLRKEYSYASATSANKEKLEEYRREVQQLKHALKQTTRRGGGGSDSAELLRLERELDEARSEIAEWKHANSELEDKCIALARSHSAMRERMTEMGASPGPESGRNSASLRQTPQKVSKFLTSLLK